MIQKIDKRDTHRARNVGLAMLGIALYVGACQIFLGTSRPRYPHAPHLEEVDCTTCHEGAEEKAVAGFPATEKGCMLCHEEIDAKKPFAKTVAALLVDGKPNWLDRGDPYGGPTRFDHGKHTEAELECKACHAPVLTDAGPGMRIHGGKRACMDCHADTERGNACEVCHEQLREDAAPPSHLSNWKRAHGAHSRRMIAGTGETTCAQCHQEEESCASCHRREAPANHTNFWRVRGHGLTASIDRTNCNTCHEPDYCSSCHESTAPRSHRGSFAAPGNRHCISCHVGPQQTGCAACHRGLPAHAPGNPLPGNLEHLTAQSPVDCLTCHIALKHPDPGLDCRACHR